MSTQKAKFELFQRLQAMGFTYEEAVKLRRIEMTLQRWAEAECGYSNSYASTSIERDDVSSMICTQCGHKHFGEDALTINCPKCGDCAPLRRKATGKVFRVVMPHNLKSSPATRYPIADREPGALKYLRGLFKGHPDLWFYHQTDPRGCALYIGRIKNKVISRLT